MKKFLPLVLVVIVIAGGAYFFSQKNKPASSENSAQKEAVAEMLADCKYDKDFCAYMVAQAQAMQKGVVINTTSIVDKHGETTSETRMNGENMEVNSYQNGQLESSMISFGGLTYFKDLRDNAWYSVGDAEGNFSDPKESLTEVEATYEDDQNMQVKKVGTESCGNLTCDKYEMVSIVGEDASSSYVWIDNKEHLARKMEFSFEGGSNVMEYRYETVQIAKPSPIKEMPMFDAPDGDEANMTDKMPSQEELNQLMQQYGADAE